jgi:protein phosphatase
LALKTLIQTYFFGPAAGVSALLSAGIRAANELVWEAGHRIPGRDGMGTTLTALAVHGDRVVIGHVGDSRAYLLRDGALDQITDDHSWVAEQVRANLLTEAEAESSPYRNIITRSIGAHPEVEADLHEIRLREGDRFLLCSDGLSGVVESSLLRDALLLSSPSMAAWRLVEDANDRGGPDNITCLILSVERIEGQVSEGEKEGTEEEEPPLPSPEPSLRRDRSAPLSTAPSRAPSEPPSGRRWFGRKRKPSG